MNKHTLRIDTFALRKTCKTDGLINALWSWLSTVCLSIICPFKVSRRPELSWSARNVGSLCRFEFKQRLGGEVKALFKEGLSHGTLRFCQSPKNELNLGSGNLWMTQTACRDVGDPNLQGMEMDKLLAWTQTAYSLEVGSVHLFTVCPSRGAWRAVGGRDRWQMLCCKRERCKEKMTCAPWNVEKRWKA